MGDTAPLARPHRPARAPLLAPAILGVAVLAAQIQTAGAFPLTVDQVPQGTELATPDVQALQHQMQLANGLVPPVGGGWTVMPYVDVQAMVTDNVLQAHQPRQWDLLTYLSPGIQLAGDMPRLQLTLDYAPGLSLYARTSSLNALTQQLNGVGLITVVPDLLFVDVRALA